MPFFISGLPLLQHDQGTDFYQYMHYYCESSQSSNENALLFHYVLGYVQIGIHM
jgi:hypothetical protein